VKISQEAEANYILASEGIMHPHQGALQAPWILAFANKACFQAGVLVSIVIEEDPIALMPDFSEEGC
jgi:hypothetical protein